MNKENSFNDILNLMEILRSENGCPWDRAQTLKTLTENIIEEAYELVEAIKNDDIDNIKEEAGDLLLQSVFIAQILKEDNRGDIFEILVKLKEKLIKRHPHVFGDKKVKTPEEAIASWNSVKHRDKEDFFLDKYKKFPALVEAYKISKKVEKIGLDWEKSEELFEKIEEESGELKEAIKTNDKKDIEEELGDLLFTIVNLSRKLNINPEIALKRSNKKFIKRVKIVMEKREQDKNLDINDLWNKAKQIV